MRFIIVSDIYIYKVNETQYHTIIKIDCRYIKILRFLYYRNQNLFVEMKILSIFITQIKID